MSHRIEGSAYVAYSASRSKTECNAGRHPGGRQQQRLYEICRLSLAAKRLSSEEVFLNVQIFGETLR